MLKWFISSRTYFNTLLVHTAYTSLALVALTWPFAEPTRLGQSRGRPPRRPGRGRGGTAAEEGGGPGRGGAGCAGLAPTAAAGGHRRPALRGSGSGRRQPAARTPASVPAAVTTLCSDTRACQPAKEKATNNSFCIALTRVRSSARHLTKTKKSKRFWRASFVPLASIDVNGYCHLQEAALITSIGHQLAAQCLSKRYHASTRSSSQPCSCWQQLLFFISLEDSRIFGGTSLQSFRRQLILIDTWKRYCASRS